MDRNNSAAKATDNKVPTAPKKRSTNIEAKPLILLMPYSSNFKKRIISAPTPPRGTSRPNIAQMKYSFIASKTLIGPDMQFTNMAHFQAIKHLSST